ncbi:c-type cytochrome [uncultured Sphingomonas sp.]|uniref:c-type cytochrome n=1 Tax=uncultured Sphingomonas sp. TaxID=158754 RepID=UPI00261F7167|nr:cytochrome c [uncultured Sphingomonas sp.]
MSMRDRHMFLARLALAVTALAFSGASAAQTTAPRLGRSAPADLIRRMDRTVDSVGTGLPKGSGTVASGRAIFATKCASCHGEGGTGSMAEAVAGGRGTLASLRPIKTVGSYWPFATTLFDYIRRAMPLSAPQTLADSEVYGLVAYLLSIDGIVPGNVRLNRMNLPRIQMPNRHGFVSLEGREFDGNIDRPALVQVKGRRP